MRLCEAIVHHLNDYALHLEPKCLRHILIQMIMLLQVHEKARSMHAEATRNVVQIIWRHNQLT